MVIKLRFYHSIFFQTEGCTAVLGAVAATGSDPDPGAILRMLTLFIQPSPLSDSVKGSFYFLKSV